MIVRASRFTVVGVAFVFAGLAAVTAACGNGGGASSDRVDATTIPACDAGLAESAPLEAAAGDGAAASPAVPPTGPSAGTATGAELYVVVRLSLDNLSSDAIGSLWVEIVVVENALSTVALKDALVTVTPSEGPTLTIPANQTHGLYQARFEGQRRASSYSVSVVHALGTRTGVVLVPPSPFTFDVTPPPEVGVASTVTWSPHDEEGVEVSLLAGTFRTNAPPPTADTGSFVLPRRRSRPTRGESPCSGRGRSRSPRA